MKVAIALSALLAATSVHATVVVFDDIPHGYIDGVFDGNWGGIRWGGNMFSSDPPSWGGGAWSIATPTGTGGRIGPNETDLWAYNRMGVQSLWLDFGRERSFRGFDIKSFPIDSRTVEVVGYDSNFTQTYRQTFAVAPWWNAVALDLPGVRYIQLNAETEGSWFAIDNLSIDEALPVPEPASVLMLLAGLALIASSTKRSR